MAEIDNHTLKELKDLAKKYEENVKGLKEAVSFAECHEDFVSSWGSGDAESALYLANDIVGVILSLEG